MSEPDLEQLRAEVAEAREQLVESTALLAQQLDVNARIRAKFAALQAFARAHQQQLSIGGGSLLVLVVVRRRRARGRRRTAVTPPT